MNILTLFHNITDLTVFLIKEMSFSEHKRHLSKTLNIFIIIYAQI